MLTFCAHILESASNWLDGHCFHNHTNKTQAYTNLKDASSTPLLHIVHTDHNTSPSTMQYTTRCGTPESMYPVPSRAVLRTARTHALSITTCLLAIEFLLDSRFKTRSSAYTALVAIRRILRAEHAGVLPDVLLDEWLRKGRPYAAGTRSKFAQDPYTGRGLDYGELERCVDAWADWGRVRGEFWFLVREQKGKAKGEDSEELCISFKRVGDVSEDEVAELERKMWAWISAKEKEKESPFDSKHPLPDAVVDAPTVSSLIMRPHAYSPKATVMHIRSLQPPQRGSVQGRWMNPEPKPEPEPTHLEDQGEWESADDAESGGDGNGNGNKGGAGSDADDVDDEGLWMVYHSM